MNIVIQDSDVVRKEDLAHNFFVSLDDAGKNVRYSLYAAVFLQLSYN